MGSSIESAGQSKDSAVAGFYGSSLEHGVHGKLTEGSLLEHCNFTHVDRL